MTQTLRAGLIVTADASSLVGEMQGGREALASLRREATVLGTDLTRSGAAATSFVSIFSRGSGAFRAFGADTKSASDSAAALGAALDQEERQFRQLVLAVDPAARAQAEFRAGQEQVTRAMRLGIATTDEAARTLAQLEARQQAVLATLDRSGAAATRFGTGLQQASFQLTDAVVQFQGGVAPAVIFAQQAPQLLGAFGALGAALGLVAALAPPVLSFFFGAGEAARDLDTILGDLEGSTGRVTDSLKLLRDPRLTETFGALTTDIREMTAAMLELERAAELRKLRETLDRLLRDSIEPTLWDRLGRGTRDWAPGAVFGTDRGFDDRREYELRADNYAELTGGRGLTYDEFAARRSEIDALAKAGEVARVTAEVNRLIRDMSAGGPVTDLNDQLAEILLTLGSVARQTAEVEADFNGSALAARTWNGLVEAGAGAWERIAARGRAMTEEGAERIRTAEGELSIAETVARWGDQSRQAEAERARVARDAYEIEQQRAGLFEADRDRLMEIYDQTAATEAATAAWADRMSAVGAELSGILSTLNSIGNSAVDRAAKRAELDALEAGASVADAAAAGRRTRREAEFSAREQGAGFFGRAAIGIERWWAEGEEQMDADLAAARAAARDRTRTTGRGSGGGLSAAAGITAELARIRPSYEADVAAAEAWRDKALAALDKAGAGYERFADDVQTIFGQKMADAYRADLERRDDWQAGVERGFLKLNDDMMSWADFSESLVTKFAESGEDAFVQFATAGKASFEGLIDFVAEQMARLVYQQMVLPGIGSLFGSIFPGVTPAGGGASLPTHHTGSPGVMRTYAIAGYGDTMRQDERLTMMRRGEEIMTARALENAGALISAMTALATRPAHGQDGTATLNVQIVNNSTARVDGRVEETTDASGQRQMLLVLSDAMADAVAVPGGRARGRIATTFGLRPAGIRR